MKHDVLRSVVHNALDSLTSGCSFVFSLHDFSFPFWQFVWSMPDGVIEADLTSGEIQSPAGLSGSIAYRRLESAMKTVARELPDFLRKNRCDPKQIESIHARFETNFKHRQYVYVRIARSGGRVTEDLYAGIPLRRLKGLDHLGRIRPVSVFGTGLSKA
ncbi:MAG: hypothetical protein AAFS13_05470 [Pseudomonadota bacterium]